MLTIEWRRAHLATPVSFFRDMLRRDQLEPEKARFRLLIEEGLASGRGRKVTKSMISEVEAQVFGEND